MANSTTSIAELPQSSGIQNLRPSVQVPGKPQVQEPSQNLPVSTQQISNEFYGHIFIYVFKGYSLKSYWRKSFCFFR